MEYNNFIVMNMEEKRKIGIILVGITLLISIFIILTPMIFGIKGEIEIVVVTIPPVMFRSIITLGMGMILFYDWYFNAINRNIKDMKLLFAVQFWFMAAGKMVDLYIYLTAGSVSAVSATPTLLPIIKIRYIMIIGTFAPLFLILISLILAKQENQKIKKKIELTADILFIVVPLIYIIASPTFTVLSIVVPLTTFPFALAVVFVFFRVYRAKRLPTFNSLIFSIAWFAYFWDQLLRPTIYGIGGTNVIWISELFETLCWIFMGLSFYIKPNYQKKNKNLVYNTIKS